MIYAPDTLDALHALHALAIAKRSKRSHTEFGAKLRLERDSCDYFPICFSAQSSPMLRPNMTSLGSKRSGDYFIEKQKVTERESFFLEQTFLIHVASKNCLGHKSNEKQKFLASRNGLHGEKIIV